MTATTTHKPYTQLTDEERGLLSAMLNNIAQEFSANVAEAFLNANADAETAFEDLVERYGSNAITRAFEAADEDISYDPEVPESLSEIWKGMTNVTVEEERELSGRNK